MECIFSTHTLHRYTQNNKPWLHRLPPLKYCLIYENKFVLFIWWEIALHNLHVVLPLLYILAAYFSAYNVQQRWICAYWVMSDQNMKLTQYIFIYRPHFCSIVFTIMAKIANWYSFTYFIVSPKYAHTKLHCVIK